MKQLSQVTHFLSELTEHNSLDWMNEHRTEYLEAKNFALECYEQVVIELMNLDPMLGIVDTRKSLFRINRDMRFSTNKKPYNPWFSITISSEGKHGQVPGYYCRINSNNQITLGFGLFETTPFIKEKIEKNISTVKQELVSIVNSKSLLKNFDCFIHLPKSKSHLQQDNNLFWISMKSVYFNTEFDASKTITALELAKIIISYLNQGVLLNQTLRKLIKV
jgi:uncharacterized protein (TIGR02453 family)